MRKLKLDEAVARFAAVHDHIRISSPGPAARVMAKVSMFLRDHATTITATTGLAAILAGGTAMFNAGMLIEHGSSPVPEMVQDFLRPIEHFGMKSIGHFFDLLSSIGSPSAASAADSMPPASEMNPKERFLGGFIGMMEGAAAFLLFHKIAEHFERGHGRNRRDRTPADIFEADGEDGKFYIAVTHHWPDRKGRRSAAIAIYDRLPQTRDDLDRPVVYYELKSEEYIGATVNSFLEEIAPDRRKPKPPVREMPADAKNVDQWFDRAAGQAQKPATPSARI